MVGEEGSPEPELELDARVTELYSLLGELWCQVSSLRTGLDLTMLNLQGVRG
jgi:hypothetical protein